MWITKILLNEGFVGTKLLIKLNRSVTLPVAVSVVHWTI